MRQSFRLFHRCFTNQDVWDVRQWNLIFMCCLLFAVRLQHAHQFQFQFAHSWIDLTALQKNPGLKVHLLAFSKALKQNDQVWLSNSDHTNRLMNEKRSSSAVSVFLCFLDARILHTAELFPRRPENNSGLSHAFWEANCVYISLSRTPCGQ